MDTSSRFLTHGVTDRLLDHSPVSALLMSISDARFALNGLLLETVFTKTDEFVDRIQMHYLSMLQMQLFKVQDSTHSHTHTLAFSSLFSPSLPFFLGFSLSLSLSLSPLFLCPLFLSFGKLLFSIETIRWFYLIFPNKVIGSSDALGSPINFVSGLGTGVYDFFHEPAKVKRKRD
jgi:hypothetical protein